MRFALLLLLCGCEVVFPLEQPFDPARCPEAFNGTTHVYFAEAMPWPSAEGNCELLDLDPDDQVFTHLTVMGSITEAAELGLPLNAQAWVGYTNARRNTTFPPSTPNRDEFEWITEEPTDPVQWNGDNPNSTSNPPIYVKVQQDDVGLHDATESNPTAGPPVGYLCECDAFPAIAERLVSR